MKLPIINKLELQDINNKCKKINKLIEESIIKKYKLEKRKQQIKRDRLWDTTHSRRDTPKK